MGVEIVTKEELKKMQNRFNHKIRELKNNMAYVPEPHGPWLMSVSQLRYKLSISRLKMNQMIEEGLLKPIRLTKGSNAKVYFRVDDVRELIEKNDEIIPLRQNWPDLVDGEVS